MNHSIPPQLRRYFSFLACAGLLCAAPVHAKRVTMTDHEMSEVSAQGLFILENSNDVGSTLHFSKIALDAEVDLSANFKDIFLGTTTTAGTTKSDISIPVLRFGRSDVLEANLPEANRLVKISNPYIQFVYNKPLDQPTQVVGVRLGFDGISGDIGTLMTSVSGSMQVVNGTETLQGTGKNLTELCSTSGCVTLSQIGGLRAGDISKENYHSRDFWISALMQPVQFKAPEGSGQVDPPIAQPGYWLNLRDRLLALNVNGTIPPNGPKK